ncbi:MAG: hypothetical protein K8R23_08905 [Chthoniobacter sp.]|nr:hypothetical protein [Chthoniobacter sp.]
MGIELVVLPSQMFLYVDGKTRQAVNADFSKIDAPLAIWTEGRTKLQVKSVEMAVP